jgi:hypothetical protein
VWARNNWYNLNHARIGNPILEQAMIDRPA